MTADTREQATRPVERRRSAVRGAFLALSSVYLAALLFRYVFGIGTTLAKFTIAPVP